MPTADDLNLRQLRGQPLLNAQEIRAMLEGTLAIPDHPHPELAWLRRALNPHAWPSLAWTTPSWPGGDLDDDPRHWRAIASAHAVGQLIQQDILTCQALRESGAQSRDIYPHLTGVRALRAWRHPGPITLAWRFLAPWNLRTTEGTLELLNSTLTELRHVALVAVHEQPGSWASPAALTTRTPVTMTHPLGRQVIAWSGGEIAGAQDELSAEGTRELSALVTELLNLPGQAAPSEDWSKVRAPLGGWHSREEAQLQAVTMPIFMLGGSARMRHLTVNQALLELTTALLLPRVAGPLLTPRTKNGTPTPSQAYVRLMLRSLALHPGEHQHRAARLHALMG